MVTKKMLANDTKYINMALLRIYNVKKTYKKRYDGNESLI